VLSRKLTTRLHVVLSPVGDTHWPASRLVWDKVLMSRVLRHTICDWNRQCFWASWAWVAETVMFFFVNLLFLFINAISVLCVYVFPPSTSEWLN
jgi:hypothetical protein